jgi:uncharacterized membrane protein required for colicin V production
MNVNFIDAIIGVALLLALFDGVRRGLIMTLFELIGLIGAFFIAFYNYPHIQLLIEKHTALYRMIHDTIGDKFAQVIEKLPFSDPTPGDFFKGFDRLPFDLQKILNDQGSTLGISDSAAAYGEQLATQITNLMLVIISFTLTFLATYFLLIIIANILNTLFKAPVLNTANKVSGGVLGLIKGLAMLYLIFAIASPFIAVSKPENRLTSAVLESKSSELFYENNLILNYMTYRGILDE